MSVEVIMKRDALSVMNFMIPFVQHLHQQFPSSIEVFTESLNRSFQKEYVSIYNAQRMGTVNHELYSLIKNEQEFVVCCETDDGKLFGIHLFRTPARMGVSMIDQHHYIFSMNNGTIHRFESRTITDCFAIPLSKQFLLLATRVFAVNSELQCFFSKEMDSVYMKNPNRYDEVSHTFPIQTFDQPIQLKNIHVLIPMLMVIRD